MVAYHAAIKVFFCTRFAAHIRNGGINFMQEILSLYGNIAGLTPQMVIMWVIGGVLIYLGIVKKMEPSLLVPMGFGAILVNLPNSGAVTQTLNGVLTEGLSTFSSTPASQTRSFCCCSLSASAQ